jgi:predicted ATPase
MRCYEIIRTLRVGRLTIRLWVEANDGPCEVCEETADNIALCATTLADEDDDPVVLAEKLMNTLNGITRAEVIDTSGHGGAVSIAMEA